MSRPTNQIDDEDAQDALSYGDKSGRVPPHSAMPPETDPDPEDADFDWEGM